MFLDKIALILAIIGGLNWGQHRAVPLRPGGLPLRRLRQPDQPHCLYPGGCGRVWCISLLFRDTRAGEHA